MFSVNLKNGKTDYDYVSPIGLIRSRYEIILYLFIGIIAVVLRFWDLGYRSVGYDESLHLFYAYQLSQGLGYEHTPVTHGPFQFHGIALLHFLFGDTEYTSRMLSAIFGSMVVFMPYFLRDKLGSYGSIITSGLLAFSPTMLFYSRYARNDIIMVFWTFAIIVCFWRYLDCGKSRYLYMTSIFLSLAFATKETTFIVLAIVGSYLLITSSTDWIPWILRKPVVINEGSLNNVNDEAYRYSDRRGFYYGSLPRKKTLKNFSRSGIFIILLFSLSIPQISAAISLIQIGTFPIPVLSTLLQFIRDFLYQSGIILANTSAPEGYPSGQIIFDIFDTQVTIRAHTPELTLDASWNLTVDPNDSWLDLPYQNHAVSLVIQVLNEDYVVEVNNVRIGFYDIPEGGSESLIGYSFIDNIANATRRGQAIIPGIAQSSITWDGSSGTDVLGNHTLVVRIDPLNEIDEWEENDNNFTFETEIFEDSVDNKLRTITDFNGNFDYMILREFAKKDYGLKDELDYGRQIIETPEHLSQYWWTYALMIARQWKIIYPCIKDKITSFIDVNGVEIIDYGCGQGGASLLFLDKFYSDFKKNISKIKLTDAGSLALQRAKMFLENYSSDIKIVDINKDFDPGKHIIDKRQLYRRNLRRLLYSLQPL